jgi:hypothetical protein
VVKKIKSFRKMFLAKTAIAARNLNNTVGNAQNRKSIKGSFNQSKFCLNLHQYLQCGSIIHYAKLKIVCNKMGKTAFKRFRYLKDKIMMTGFSVPFFVI